MSRRRAANSSGVSAAKDASKRCAKTVSMPALPISEIFSPRLERRAGAVAGEKNSRGNGSKVRAAAARPRSRAAPQTWESMARCPRCTPSKLPMAIAVSDADRAWRTIFTGSFVAREVAQAKSHHRERGEVRDGAHDDRERELERALRGGDLEPRKLASHRIPERAAHEVERHHELEEERGPSRFRPVRPRAPHEPPEPARVEARPQ